MDKLQGAQLQVVLSGTRASFRRRVTDAMGDLVPAERIDPSTGAIELKVNGAVRQSSNLSNMIWNVPETIAYLSRLVRLAPGDLIMTGTPEGVGAALPGDVLEGAIAGIGIVRTRIV